MADLPVSDGKHVYDSIIGVIGKTPLVKLGHVARGVAPPIYAKLEPSTRAAASRTAWESTLSSRRRNAANSSPAARL